MKILVTGSAGFIGCHLVKRLLQQGHDVVGFDNINDYYDVNLKYSRLSELGIIKNQISWGEKVCATENSKFTFVQEDLANKEFLISLFAEEKFDIVVNLAAQAGVRYSITNPDIYVKSNVVGFYNILEACRAHPVKHLVYASSSSVYGSNAKIPFSVGDKADHPISLYAASKKSNELMAHTYSHLFKIKVTGLRFFTVYGPWGRPDMALFLFTKKIIEGEPIPIFNYGELERDFTYVADIIDGIERVLTIGPKQEEESDVPYKLYNIGNSKPVKLMAFVKALEDALGKKAILNMLPMQPGDVPATWADVDDLKKDYEYSPRTDVITGIKNFVAWYKSYYKVD